MEKSRSEEMILIPRREVKEIINVLESLEIIVTDLVKSRVDIRTIKIRLDKILSSSDPDKTPIEPIRLHSINPMKDEP
jgi:hypothetical protein